MKLPLQWSVTDRQCSLNVKHAQSRPYFSRKTKYIFVLQWNIFTDTFVEVKLLFEWARKVNWFLFHACYGMNFSNFSIWKYGYFTRFDMRRALIESSGITHPKWVIRSIGRRIWRNHRDNWHYEEIWIKEKSCLPTGNSCFSKVNIWQSLNITCP